MSVKLLSIAIFMVLSIFNSYATNNDKSKLVLRIWDDSEFIVSFDKKRHKTSVSKFKISKIKPGKHKIKIFKEIYGPMGYHEEELIYKGSINILPSSKITAKINRYNELIIVSVQPLNEDDDLPDNEKRKNMLSVFDLKKLKEDLGHQRYESDKLNIALEKTSKKRIKTSQVIVILEHFGFESTKLEFAQKIYPLVFDKKKFTRINEVFIKKESIESLKNFIKEYHAKEN